MPPSFTPPAPPSAWRWLHGAVGREMFGRPAGPWGVLFAPVPLAGLILAVVNATALRQVMWPWLTERLGELAWLLFMPFLFATIGQAIAMAVSDHVWKESEGDRHIDFSPRTWHYAVSSALAVVPLVLLQVSTTFLDAYLEIGLKLRGLTGGLLASGHAGYSPGLGNLLVVGVVPLVFWQVQRMLEKIPSGRLLGLQRELARLRGAVSWQPEAWAELVADTVDKWLADATPPDSDTPPRGERQRQHRVRWGGLRKEIVSAWQQSPPDLARANRALHVYRDGW